MRLKFFKIRSRIFIYGFCDEFCAELDDLCIDERDEELIFKCDVHECLKNCNSYSEEKRRISMWNMDMGICKKAKILL